MSAFKSGLVALTVVASLAGSAHAQKSGDVYGSSSFAAYPGAGANQGSFGRSYYSINGGFGNYGLPGAYPNYAGYGLSGYGPGANLGGYFRAVPNTPGVYNNMGGLINTIKQQTGKPGGYRSNSGSGVSRNRPVRRS